MDLKKKLCWIISLVLLLSLGVLASGENSSFDPSLFENDDGFIRQDGSNEWMFFKGIVFNDVDGKSVQLSVQADGSDSGAAPQVRLFVLVTEPEDNRVTEFGTPKQIQLTLNGSTVVDLSLPDRYNNPACASLILDDSGETLCGYLTDVQNLSLDISFEDSDRKLSYELTDQNIDVFRRSIGKICSLLIGSGIFDELAGSSDISGQIDIEQIPEITETSSVTPAPISTPASTPDPEPVSTPSPAPTASPTPSPSPTSTPEPAPADESASAEQSISRLLRGVKPGGLIQFGRYQQGVDQEREAVSWLVLTVEMDKRRVLLLADKGLDMISFGEPNDSGAYLVSGLNWENSYIRSWLNGEFYNETFSEEEKQHIVETGIKTRDKTGSRYTVDKVFLLDSKEAKKYLKTPFGMACVLTEYAFDKLPSASDAVAEGYCRWWLRELGEVLEWGRDVVYLKGSGNEAGFVDGNHGLKQFYRWVGCPIFRDDYCAVRPALWVSLN